MKDQPPLAPALNGATPLLRPVQAESDPLAVRSWTVPTWAEEGYIDGDLVVHRRAVGQITLQEHPEILRVDLTRFDDASPGTDPDLGAHGHDNVSLNGHLLTLAETQALRELLATAVSLTVVDAHRRN